MRLSLRLRLALGISLVVACSLGVLGFVVVRSTRADLEHVLRHLLDDAVANRMAMPAPPPDRGRSADPRRLATAHLLIGPQNEVVLAEPAGPPTSPLPLPAPSVGDLVALRAGRAVTVAAADDTLRYLALGAARPDGSLEVEAGPLNQIDDTMAALARRLAAGSVVTLVLAVGAVIVVLGHGLRPLRTLIDTADAVAAGERERRIPTDDGPVEIRRLSVAIDTMVQQQRTALLETEQSEARLRRFIADASHELQTPITSVLGWTQLLQRDALDDDDATAALDRVASEGRRMATLVEELLLLARLDEHRPLTRRPTDLAAIAHDAVLDARAVEPNRTITLDTAGPVMADVDPDRLRQVLDNLLRNVRVHTPAGTAATVTVRAAGAEAIIVIDDNGPGIDPDHLDDVFDRFWRQDPSRTRATGGTGLGLAIVTALVGAHDGRVGATNRAGGGASFTVRLPRSAPAQHDPTSDGS